MQCISSVLRRSLPLLLALLGFREAAAHAPNPMAESYYARLGVEPGVSAEELKIAWRKCAKIYHTEEAKKADYRKVQLMNDAWAVLKDPDKRAEYDWQHGFSPPKKAGPDQGKPSQSTGKNSQAKVSSDPLLDWADLVADTYNFGIDDVVFDFEFHIVTPNFIDDLRNKLIPVLLPVKPLLIHPEISHKDREKLVTKLFETLEKIFLEKIVLSRPSIEQIFAFHDLTALFERWLSPDRNHEKYYRKRVYEHAYGQMIMFEASLWRKYVSSRKDQNAALWREVISHLQNLNTKSRDFVYRSDALLGYFLGDQGFPNSGVHHLMINLYPRKPSGFLEKERADDVYMRAIIESVLDYIERSSANVVWGYFADLKNEHRLFRYNLPGRLEPLLDSLGFIRADWRRFPDLSLRAEKIWEEIHRSSGQKFENKVWDPLVPQEPYLTCERNLLIPGREHETTWFFRMKKRFFE